MLLTGNLILKTIQVFFGSEFTLFFLRLLSLTERFQQLWVQQYQAPSNGLNNIIAALNTSIQRLLANVDTSDL